MWITLILILILAILLWPMISRGTLTKSNSTDIDGQTVQRILESFQTKKPNLIPVNTVYVNRDSGGLKSRIMFLDGFKGVQYDITSGSDGTVTDYRQTSVSSVLEGPYKAFKPDSNTSEL